MAKEKPRSLVKLTPEQKLRLEELEGEFEAADADLDAFEEIGMDVSKMKEMLAYSMKARRVLLARFGE